MKEKCESLRPHIRCMWGVWGGKAYLKLIQIIDSMIFFCLTLITSSQMKARGKERNINCRDDKDSIEWYDPKDDELSSKMGLKWCDYIVFSSRTQKASSVIYYESHKFDALPQSCSRKHAQIYKLIKQAVTLAKCTLSWTLSCYGKLFAWLRFGVLLPENQELNATWMKFIRLEIWILKFLRLGLVFEMDVSEIRISEFKHMLDCSCSNFEAFHSREINEHCYPSAFYKVKAIQHNLKLFYPLCNWVLRP